jgi:trehalose 6-phosphate phosphatase
VRNIFSRANRDVIRQFARSRVLLAFDYDGTLAPIVREPTQAVMRASTRALLEDTARFYPCVVISGRAQQDALGRLKGVSTLEVFGNHGVEPWQVSDRFRQEVRRWRPVVERHVLGLPGVHIEDKLFSIAIHFRQSRQKRRARTAIRRATALLGDVRVIPGKQVINVLPQGAPHKGMALEKARARLGCDTALYVGDDETDEDVFGLDQPGQLLTIRVGRKKTSAAAYYIPSQRDIDVLLRTLLHLRSDSQTGGRTGW